MTIGIANPKSVRTSRISRTDNGKLTLAGKDRGFTIIELLVVMAIIGLLAAIAIPVFSKLKNNAYDSAAQNDLRQAAIQVESYGSTNNGYPATGVFTTAVVPNIKMTNAQETMAYTVNGTASFAITNYDTRTSNVYCYSSANGGQKLIAVGSNTVAQNIALCVA